MRIPRRPGLVIVLAFVLAACSGGSADTSNAEPTSTTMGTTTGVPTTTQGSSTTSVTTTTTTTTTITTITEAPSDLAVLGGLGFGEFLEASYELLLVRSPQYLTSLGVAADYGIRNDRLDDMSPAFLEETQALEAGILDLLRTYDRASLSDTDRVSFDVYEWYLDQRVRGHRFAYHDYPVHHFVNSYNFNLILFLSEEHPLVTTEDIEDYLARLSQIDEQVAEVIERLRISEEMGVMPPAVIVDWTIGTLQQDLGGAATASAVRATRLPLYTSFAERLDRIGDIDETTGAALLAQVAAELEASFVPAWISLIEHMKEIRPRAGSDAGVWRLPDGDAYYAYLLREHTSTGLTAAEIHQIGLDNVARVEGELRKAFTALGYPEDASIGELRRRAANEAGFLDGKSPGGADAVVAAYEALIAEAEAAARGVFNVWPNAEVGIVAEAAGQGGYYVSGSVDGSRPGAFHAGVGGTIAAYTMPTVTYHEAVPGHHTQIAISQELDLPTFRRFTRYNGFIEGWALYAERLAAELGLYAADPYGDIGRLELELLRAVRLVVDTGIHSMRWAREEARAYMDQTITGWSHEVERYMVLPGQATGYMIGMQALLDLRAQVLADGSNDLAAFHDLVLGAGGVPLEILEETIAGNP